MSRINWGLPSDLQIESGLDRGVYYPKSGPGIVWNGLLSIFETETDSEEKGYYHEGVRFLTKQTAGNFNVALVAYTYPEELDENDHIFGLSYRTRIETPESSGYKLHLVYNISAEPTDIQNSTINQSADAIQFSWSLTTTPIKILNKKPSAHFIIDSRITYPWVLQVIEDTLYGTEHTDPYLPTIEEVLGLFEEGSILRITDHGDGTWTADGPDDVVYFTGETEFEIDYSTVVYLNPTTYQVSSL